MTSLTEFDRRAIEAVAGSHMQKHVLLSQLEYATCRSRRYTGVGLYTEVSVPASCPRLVGAFVSPDSMPTCVVSHPELEHGASLILWVERGVISCLEAVALTEDWPKDESLFEFVT